LALPALVGAARVAESEREAQRRGLSEGGGASGDLGALSPTAPKRPEPAL